MPWGWVEKLVWGRIRSAFRCRCLTCGYRWFPKKRNCKLDRLLKPTHLPVQCPKCHSRNWNAPSPTEERKAEVGYQCRCQRPTCGHVWISINTSMPVVCPKCRSMEWGRKPRRYRARKVIDRPRALAGPDGRVLIG